VRLDLGLAAPIRVVAIGDIHFDPRYETDAKLGNLVRQTVTDYQMVRQGNG